LRIPFHKQRAALSGLTHAGPQFGRLVLNARAAGNLTLSPSQTAAAQNFSNAVKEKLAQNAALSQLIDRADKAGVDVVCKAGPDPFQGLPNTAPNNDLYLTLGLYQKDSKTPAPQNGQISVGQVLNNSQFPSTPNALAQTLLDSLQALLKKALPE
jgi:hypothetical protein